MSLSWCLYGDIIPTEDNSTPPLSNAHVNCCTIVASVSLDTRPSLRDSYPGTLSVFRNTTGRLGSKHVSTQFSTKEKQNCRC